MTCTHPPLEGLGNQYSLASGQAHAIWHIILWLRHILPVEDYLIHSSNCYIAHFCLTQSIDSCQSKEYPPDCQWVEIVHQFPCSGIASVWKLQAPRAWELGGSGGMLPCEILRSGVSEMPFPAFWEKIIRYFTQCYRILKVVIRHLKNEHISGVWIYIYVYFIVFFILLKHIKW